MGKEEKDYGEPIRYDPDFNGPIHNRSCTDVLWLILFILYLGVWGFIGYYAMTHGNMQKLLAPIDSNGNRCGLNSWLQDKKYLVFFDITRCLQPDTPITGCPTPQVCVNQCPDRTINFEKELTAANFNELKSRMVCKYDVDISTYEKAMQSISEEKCAKSVLKSEAVLFRCIGDLSTMPRCAEAATASSRWTGSGSGGACLRNPEKAQESLLTRATALDTYVGWITASWVTYFKGTERDTHILSAQIAQDMVQARWYIVGAVLIVILICFVYILVLRWVVGPVVWTSIVAFLILLGFSCYLCYKEYKYYLANPVQQIATSNIKGYAESIVKTHTFWLVVLIIAAIVLLILTLIVIFLRNRIVIAIALIREGSKAVSAIKSTVFFPILPWVMQCLTIAYGVFVLMYIISMGESLFSVVNKKIDPDCVCNGNYTDYASCDPIQFQLDCHDSGTILPCKKAICYFTGLDSPHSVVYLHLGNLLGFFWTMFFISGCSDMMLASTFATWYWTFRKRNLPFFTLTAGVARTVRYHMGTVALGSLIIAIVRIIRVILEYIDQKLKKFDNAFTRAVLCCCKCFFWCLENFLKFINKNAYIMCAVHGTNFCASARDAFSLLMRNIVRVVVLDKVADFIFFLSKLLLSIGVGFAVYYFLDGEVVSKITGGKHSLYLHNNYIPAVFLGIITYIIGSIFFQVYSMAVDTLFLCFLEDCERNDGSPEKPYFMSKNLMKILGKRNKKYED
ncbi:choline transporter-like 2 isoform X2 [Plodia interpunctella]|uniref:choline transporter-like 2 isoform X2 n=1 Tax=Plodia interpunctella TaxID=58824 RepID=UPI0023689B34|nr:choline transporter-like 2 isoform X2 [Plodia interpunctella]